MASVSIVDETVVLVPQTALLALLRDRVLWVRWWPGSDATVVRDADGSRLEWSLSGALVGSSTIILTARGEEVLVRYSLDADPSEPGSRTRSRALSDSPHGRREARELRQRHHLAWKRSLWSLTMQYEEILRSRDRASGR